MQQQEKKMFWKRGKNPVSNILYSFIFLNYAVKRKWNRIQIIALSTVNILLMFLQCCYTPFLVHCKLVKDGELE